MPHWCSNANTAHRPLSELMQHCLTCPPAAWCVRSLSKEYKDGGFELQDTLHKRNLPDVPQIFHSELKKAVGRFGGVSGDIGEDSFFRMARDAKLRNSLLTDSQIVVIFGLCKEKHMDTMEFESFLTKAVPLLSVTAEIDIQRVCKRLVDAEPESVHNKFARAVRNASVFDKLTDVNRHGRHACIAYT